MAYGDPPPPIDMAAWEYARGLADEVDSLRAALTAAEAQRDRYRAAVIEAWNVSDNGCPWCLVDDDEECDPDCIVLEARAAQTAGPIALDQSWQTEGVKWKV